MAELLGRKPLLPGKDYVDQLKLIIKSLGPPSEDDLTFINSQKARAYIRALPPAEVRNKNAVIAESVRRPGGVMLCVLGTAIGPWHVRLGMHAAPHAWSSRVRGRCPHRKSTSGRSSRRRTRWPST